MTNEDKKHVETAPETAAQQPRETGDGGSQRTRRRLLRAGLVGVPTVMTLHSRPVYGQSLGSLGIGYGAYTQGEGPDTNQWVPAVPDGEGNMIPDPNGPDRRPNTGDEPRPKSKK